MAVEPPAVGRPYSSGAHEHGASALIESLVQGVTALAALMTIVALLWRFPVQTAITSIGLATALDCFDIGREGWNFGISIYADDIACAILLCAGALAIVRWRKLPPRNWWFVLALFGLVVLNMVRGAAEFGVKPAGKGVRGLTYLIVPPIAFMLLRPALRLDSARFAKWLSFAGSFFAVIALCRWASVLPAPEWALQDNFREIPRVLPAEYAMVLGLAVLAVLYLQLARGFSWWGTTLAGAFAVELLFLQHRSVWIATVVGLIWLTIRTAGLSKRLWVGAAAGTLLALVIWSSVTPGLVNGVSAIIKANIQETEQTDSTWAWRTQGFEEALNRTFSGSAEEMLIGPPAGRNLGSEANFASVAIHDRYVDTLAYYGMLGEILLVVWLLLVAKGVGGWVAFHRQQGREYKAGRVFLQALLLSQLTYFIPYSGGLPLGAAFGLMWVVATARPMKRKSIRVLAYTRTLQAT
jgi:hypothetical protein